MATQDILASVSTFSRAEHGNSESVDEHETDLNDMKSNREWEGSETDTESEAHLPLCLYGA